MTRLMRRTRLRWQLMPKHAKKWLRRLKVARDLSIPASRVSRSLGRSEYVPQHQKVLAKRRTHLGEQPLMMKDETILQQ
jgi:hypothetical protein